jgi:hypothetical protein
MGAAGEDTVCRQITAKPDETPLPAPVAPPNQMGPATSPPSELIRLRHTLPSPSYLRPPFVRQSSLGPHPSGFLRRGVPRLLQPTRMIHMTLSMDTDDHFGDTARSGGYLTLTMCPAYRLS